MLNATPLVEIVTTAAPVVGALATCVSGYLAILFKNAVNEAKASQGQLELRISQRVSEVELQFTEQLSELREHMATELAAMPEKVVKQINGTYRRVGECKLQEQVVTNRLDELRRGLDELRQRMKP